VTVGEMARLEERVDGYVVVRKTSDSNNLYRGDSIKLSSGWGRGLVREFST